MKKSTVNRSKNKGANSRSAEVFLEKYGQHVSNNIFDSFNTENTEIQSKTDENSINKKSSIMSFFNSSCDQSLTSAISLINKKSDVSKEKGFRQLENSLTLFTSDESLRSFIPIWNQIYKRYTFDGNQSIRILLQQIHSIITNKYSHIFIEYIDLFVIPWFLSTCDLNKSVAQLAQNSFNTFFCQDQNSLIFANHASNVYEYIEKKIITFIEVNKSKKSSKNEQSESFHALVTSCFFGLKSLIKRIESQGDLNNKIIKHLTDWNTMKNISTTELAHQFVDILENLIDLNLLNSDETLKIVTKFSFSNIDEKSYNLLYENSWRLLVSLAEKQNKFIFDWSFTRNFWAKIFLLLSSVNSNHIEITYSYFYVLSKFIDFKDLKINKQFYLSSFNSINQFLNLTQNCKSNFNKENVSFEMFFELLSWLIINYIVADNLQSDSDLMTFKFDKLFPSYYTGSIIWKNQKINIFNSFTHLVENIKHLITNEEIRNEVIVKIISPIFSNFKNFTNHLNDILNGDNKEVLIDKNSVVKLNSFLYSFDILKSLKIYEFYPTYPDLLQSLNIASIYIINCLKHITTNPLKRDILAIHCVLFELEHYKENAEANILVVDGDVDNKMNNNYSSTLCSHLIDFVFPLFDTTFIKTDDFTYVIKLIKYLSPIDLNFLFKSCLMEDKKDKIFLLYLIKNILSKVDKKSTLYEIVDQTLVRLMEIIFDSLNQNNIYESNHPIIDEILQIFLLKEDSFTLKIKKLFSQYFIRLISSENKNESTFIVIFEWILQNINLHKLFDGNDEIELLFDTYFTYNLSKNIDSFNLNLNENKVHLMVLIKSLIKTYNLKLFKKSKLLNRHDSYLIQVLGKINFYSLLLESNTLFFELLSILKINQSEMECKFNQIYRNNNKSEVILDLCSKICFLPLKHNINDNETITSAEDLDEFINSIQTFNILIFQLEFPLQSLFEKYSNNDEVITYFTYFIIITIFLQPHRTSHFLNYIFKFKTAQFYNNILRKTVQNATNHSCWCVLLYHLYTLKIWSDEESSFSTLVTFLPNNQILNLPSYSPKLAFVSVLFGSLTNYEHITDFLLFYMDKFEPLQYKQDRSEIINLISIINSLFGNFLFIKSLKDDKQYEECRDQFIWCLERYSNSDILSDVFKNVCLILNCDKSLTNDVDDDDFYLVYSLLTLFRHSIHIYAKFGILDIKMEYYNLLFSSLKNFVEHNIFKEKINESFLRCLFEIKNIVLICSSENLLNLTVESKFGNDLCLLINFPSFLHINEVFNNKITNTSAFTLNSHFETLCNIFSKDMLILYMNSCHSKINLVYLNILTNILLIKAQDSAYICSCLQQIFPEKTFVEIYNIFLEEIFKDSSPNSFATLVYLISLLRVHKENIKAFSLLDSIIREPAEKNERGEYEDPFMKKLNKTILTFDRYNSCKDIFHNIFPRNVKGVFSEIKYSFKVFKFCFIFMDIISFLPIEEKCILFHNSHFRKLILALISVLFDHLPISSKYKIPQLKLSSFKMEMNCKNAIQLNNLSIIRIANECPSLLCEYIRNLEHKKTNITRKFCIEYICPSLISYQINNCISSLNKEDKLMLIPKPGLNRILVRYEGSDNDFIEFNLEIPSNYPFDQLRVEAGDTRMTKSKEFNTHITKLQHFILTQKGTFLDGIRIWKCNMDKRLQGAEACSICYCIINSDDYTLPTSICAVCQKGVHFSCLTKWFISSDRKLCPNCRSNFY